MRVFGWGVAAGLFLGVVATLSVGLPAYRRVFGPRAERRREEELAYLRRRVAALEEALQKKDEHIQMAMKYAVEELVPKKQKEAKTR